MLGFNRWHLLKGLAAILCVAGIVSLALAHFIPAPPSQFTIATGLKNQIYEAIGNRYREILARHQIHVDVRLTNGGLENLKLLNDPNSGVTAGIVQGGLSDGARSPGLMSLGGINYQIYWIFYNATETLDNLRQLRGKHIALGLPGAGNRPMTEQILEISGVTSENSTWLGLTAQGAANALNDGRVDALFLPLALNAPVLLSH